MMLAADLGPFCNSLSNAETHCAKFSTAVSIVLKLAPTLDHVPPRYQDDLTD
jgi:hypothetical protein